MDSFTKRLARVAFVFFLFGVSGLQAQVLPDTLLVVVPARGSSVQSAAVEDTVKALKSAREQLEIEAMQLPILRLNHRQNGPAQVLQNLGVRTTSTSQVLLCRRGPSGWPEEVLGQCSPGENLLVFVRRATRPSSEKRLPPRQPDPKPPRSSVESAELASTGQVGILLVYRSEQKELVQPFLSELGRHWIERYGRVRPSPFPLASYDLSAEDVREGVKNSFPELLIDDSPKVALCFFLRNRPVKVLEVFDEVELPATLVRRISAERRRHLADSISTVDVVVVPDPSVLDLSDEQERTVLLSRVHELAQQLWRGSTDPISENKLAHRALQQIVELSKFDGPGSHVWSEELREALADFKAEPLLLEQGSKLVPVQKQFLEILHRLGPDA